MLDSFEKFLLDRLFRVNGVKLAAVGIAVMVNVLPDPEH
jgi:hypothetical protein